MSSANDDSNGTPIELPHLGVGDAPIQLVQWLVAVGAEVIEGERVAEVLADGVLFHVEAPASGLLTSILVSGGAQLSSDVVLGYIE